MNALDNRSLVQLLEPFLCKPLSSQQLNQLRTYLDLVLKWNSKMNLTSVRKPKEIVTRHFGESLFAAEILGEVLEHRRSLLDLGSGAGFPGLPIKIAIPELSVALAESQIKKATFLREVIRSLGLEGIEVHAGRAEDLKSKFDVLTMRAVDRQEKLLDEVSSLIPVGGVLLLMLGRSGAESSAKALPHFQWKEPRPLPMSASRVVLIGTRKTAG